MTDQTNIPVERHHRFAVAIAWDGPDITDAQRKYIDEGPVHGYWWEAPWERCAQAIADASRLAAAEPPPSLPGGVRSKLDTARKCLRSVKAPFSSGEALDAINEADELLREAISALPQAGPLPVAPLAPIPLFLTCPMCGTRHVDRGEFATKPHHTHSCQNPKCCLTWRPAVEHTVGVQHLPGFLDARETPDACEAVAPLPNPGVERALELLEKQIVFAAAGHRLLNPDVVDGLRGVIKALRSASPQSEPVALRPDRVAALEAEVLRLRALINRDKTGLAAALSAINDIAKGCDWIPAGEWGSYDYTQQTFETLRSEIGNLLDAVRQAAMGALNESGRRADSAFKPENKSEPPTEQPEQPQVDRQRCACTLVKPCFYACSCGYPGMSGGCRRCATYGSAEQRLAVATRIAEQISFREPIVEAEEQPEQLCARLGIDIPSWAAEVRAKVEAAQHESDQCGPVSHDEAREIVQQFIDSHFNNRDKPKPNIEIPANPKRDADLRLHAYVVQQQNRDSEQAARIASLEAQLADTEAISQMVKAERDSLRQAVLLAREELGEAEDGEALLRGANDRIVAERDSLKAELAEYGERYERATANMRLEEMGHAATQSRLTAIAKERDTLTSRLAEANTHALVKARSETIAERDALMTELEAWRATGARGRAMGEFFVNWYGEKKPGEFGQAHTVIAKEYLAALASLPKPSSIVTLETPAAPEGPACDHGGLLDDRYEGTWKCEFCGSSGYVAPPQAPSEPVQQAPEGWKPKVGDVVMRLGEYASLGIATIERDALQAGMVVSFELDDQPHVWWKASELCLVESAPPGAPAVPDVSHHEAMIKDALSQLQKASYQNTHGALFGCINSAIRALRGTP